MNNLLINYRDIFKCDNAEILIWDEWRYDLDITNIINWLEAYYKLIIKDVYGLHFLTVNKVLNIVLCIQDDIIGLKTYIGNEAELLIMFSIIVSDDNLYNLKRISNIVEKRVIMRDIKLSKII